MTRLDPKNVDHLEQLIWAVWWLEAL